MRDFNDFNEFDKVRRNRSEGGRGSKGRGGHRHGGPGGHGVGPGGHGAPPWLELFDGPGGRRRGRGGPRVRRGDVRSAILDVLASTDEELNGYQVIQQIATRTEGTWRPSPGSIYPTIAQLEDEGLVDTDRDGGRKVVFLTEAGRTYATEHAEELAAVWKPFTEAAQESPNDLRPVAGQTMAAVWQVAMTGTHDQHQRAAEILADTRRKLYGLLAEGPDDAE